MPDGRWRRWGAAVAGGALLMSACSPAGGGQDDDATFVVARTADLDLLDPAKATAFQTVQTLDLVYDTLLETDAQGTLVPGLAREWKVSTDATRLTFTLRRGVVFHDGSELTAADAKATLERILDEETGSVVRSYFLDVENIRTPNSHTLVLELSQPNASVAYALAQVGASILDEADIEGDTVARNPNGTGPFGWGAWDKGQRVTLTANPKYWNGAPELERVEFRVIPDEASILSGMQAGSFHLGIVSNPRIAGQAEGSDSVKLTSQPNLSYHVLMLNGRRGPLKELAVRQAIACALDRRQVIDNAYVGFGQVTGPITSPAFEYDPTAGLPCEPPDVDAAKRLLAEAGYGDGFRLDMIVMVGQYATATDIAQSVQAQLKKIGVRLELEQQQTDVYVQNWLDAKFDAAVALNGGSFDPYLMYNRYFTSDGSLTTPAGLSADPLDRLLRRGKATSDETERRQIFADLQQELLRLSPWAWLLTNTTFYLTAPEVTGFTATPDESLDSLARTRLGG